jgi:phosphatidate cytidylyltransferase
MESASPSPPSNLRAVFYRRLLSTVSLWAVVGLAVWSGDLRAMVAVAAFFGLAGTFEFAGLVRGSESRQAKSHASFMIIMCTAWWLGAVWFVFQRGELPFWWDLIILMAAMQGSFLLCFRQGLEGEVTLRRVFSTVFGVLYTVVCFGFLVRVLLEGQALLLFVIAVTKFSDMGAYAVGCLIGRHKMCPSLSPAKSWEGFVGAFIGGYVAASLVLWLRPAEELLPLKWVHCESLVPLLVLAAVVGDLAESVMKRCLAIKNSGRVLPGIGGVLDLTDSLIFAVPIFYGCLKWIEG